MSEHRTNRLPFFAHRCMRRAEDVLARAGIRDEALLLGVSGGGDSMALLEILGLVAPRLGLILHVACVDHGVRPEAAAEQAMVRDAAERRGVIFHGATLEPGGDDEDTLRRARYAALEAIAREASCRFIALGHSSDDQIETIVFRFLRGAGLGGLAGMREVSPPLVRPLLSTSREELRRLLRARGVAWSEDATNLSDRYARGRLRSSVLPAIEAAFGRGALAHLLDVAPRWRSDEDLLEIEAGRLLAYASRGGQLHSELDTAALASAHPALRARALRRWLLERTGRTPTSREISAIERWLDWDRSGRGRLDLAGACLVRVDGRLTLAATRESGSATCVEAAKSGVDITPSSDDPISTRGQKDDRHARTGEKAVLPPAEGRVRFPRN